MADEDEALCYRGWIKKAQERMDGKAKPLDSLGALEAWACRWTASRNCRLPPSDPRCLSLTAPPPRPACPRLSALQRTLTPAVGRACLLLFAADHGVTLERPSVSAYPRQARP
jgi:hypothetical protein